MIIKEFRELVRDKRTLGLLVAMPLLLLVIFGYAANFYVSSVQTAVVGPQANTVAAGLPSYFEVTDKSTDTTAADARDMLRDNKVDVAMVTGDSPTAPIEALVDGPICLPRNRRSVPSTSSVPRCTSRCSSIPRSRRRG